MTPEEKTIETVIHCLGVRAEQEVCEECPAYLEGGIACREAARAAISALEELQQYREIGTVEECREAMEKQMPKKPRDVEYDHSYFVCDNCGTAIYTSDEFDGHHYCLNCGSAINWPDMNSEGTEDE